MLRDIIFDEIGERIDIIALPADTDVHGRDHIHAQFQHGRFRGSVGKRHLLQRIGYVKGSLVHIDVVGELKLYDRRVFRVDGIDVLDPAHGAERSFQRLADLCLHFLGAGSRIRRDHHHIGDRNRRKEIRRDARNRNDPERNDDNHRDQDRKWFFYTVFRHEGYPFFFLIHLMGYPKISHLHPEINSRSP